ncbi:hypothetical protein ACR3K2_24010 [Cryptosporidium serpentis]
MRLLAKFTVLLLISTLLLACGKYKHVNGEEANNQLRKSLDKQMEEYYKHGAMRKKPFLASYKNKKIHSPRIVDISNECIVALSNTNLESRINYEVIHYCYIKNNWGTMVIILMWSAILFYLCSIVAEVFLSSLMVQFASDLNLTDNIAGCTLLAFGNASGDVMMGIYTCLVASNDDSLYIGDMLGSTVFVTNLVFGSVILFSPNKVIVNKQNFTRDFLFLYIGLVIITLFTYWATIPVAITPLFIIMYCCYVAIAFTQDQLKGNLSKVNSQIVTSKISSSRNSKIVDVETCEINKLLQGENEQDSLDGEVIYKIMTNSMVSLPYMPRYETSGILASLKAIKESAAIIALQIFEWTIPSPLYSRYKTACFPFSITLLICLNENYSLKFTLFGLIFSIIFHIWGNIPNFFSQGKLRSLLLAIGVLISIYWNSIIISELVQCLLLAGKIIGLSPQILGFTIIAWGNSLSDFVTNVSVSKIGHADMGLSGCYGAPVFLIYFGFGLIVLIQCIKNGFKPVPILLEKSSAFIPLAIQLVWLPIAFATMATQKFQLFRYNGILYILVFVAITTFELFFVMR